MISKIYLDKNYKILTTKYFPPEEIEKYTYKRKLGDLETWVIDKDDNKCFISLGGSKEKPLMYQFPEKGWTNFLVYIRPIDKNLQLPPLDYFMYLGSSINEFSVKNNKFYYYPELYSPKLPLLEQNFFLFGEKDEIITFDYKIIKNSEFKAYSTTRAFDFYYYMCGEPSFITSSITAQFRGIS